MKKIIGFFTGARSDYGLTKRLLKMIQNDNFFELRIYVSGMHLLEKFGNTYEEIESDNFKIFKKIYTYNNVHDKKSEFTNSVNLIYDSIIDDCIDCAYIVGDRIEAYSAALALHFCKTPIFHYAGGQITKGAVDNIYRYNITNLSTLHFATVKSAFERLAEYPLVEKKNLHFTGSTAIDSIFEFLKSPVEIKKYFPELKESNYALMTFHSATNSNENICETMKFSINRIISANYKVLITYPNNDQGSKEIIDLINTYKYDKNIVIVKNLTSEKYYSAIKGSKFVIGNSSSGIIEVPYFNKTTINIGSRQDGRDFDNTIIDCSINIDELEKVFELGFNTNWRSIKPDLKYGAGDSSIKILNIMKNYFNENK